MQQKEYYISVGEPWDFESSEGKNIIKGCIIEILSPSCLVFKANYSLKLKGFAGAFLVLYPRHFTNDFNDLRNGKDYVTVNVNVLPKEYDIGMDEIYLKNNSEFVISGSIRPNY